MTGMNKEKLNKKCNYCGENLIRTHLKDCWIDDFIDGCDNINCSNYEDAEKTLLSFSRSEARREQEEI